MSTIRVEARDQTTGQLLAGTDFAFELAGELAGTIISSNGHGDITLPEAYPGPLKVTATYKGETRTENVNLSPFTFTFKRDTT